MSIKLIIYADDMQSNNLSQAILETKKALGLLLTWFNAKELRLKKS